jgi:hypothetical protein
LREAWGRRFYGAILWCGRLGCSWFPGRSTTQAGRPHHREVLLWCGRLGCSCIDGGSKTQAGRPHHRECGKARTEYRRVCCLPSGRPRSISGPAVFLCRAGWVG